MDIKSIEKKLSFLAIPNLTNIIVFSQVILYLFISIEPQMRAYTTFVPALVLKGEIWRILTFLFMPPPTSLFFLIFIWGLLLFFGKNLEAEMGDLRYTLFILVGVIATIIASIPLTLLLIALFPEIAHLHLVTNSFLMTTILIAFARYNPEFQINLFFILPVKVKWLAYATWAGLLISFFKGDIFHKIAIIASIANIILFFGKSYYQDLRYGTKKVKNNLKEIQAEIAPNHRCTICGKTDKSNPELEFRYCSKCQGTPCYCEEHLKTHQHIK